MTLAPGTGKYRYMPRKAPTVFEAAGPQSMISSKQEAGKGSTKAFQQCPMSYKFLTYVAVHSSCVFGESVAKQHMYPPSNLLELSHFLFKVQANRDDKGFRKKITTAVVRMELSVAGCVYCKLVEHVHVTHVAFPQRVG